MVTIGEKEYIDLANFTEGEVPDPLQYTYKYADGTPIDISSGALTFHVKEVSGVATSRAAVITDGLNGVGKYTWVAADLATAGHYEGQFWVTKGTLVRASPVVRWYVSEGVRAP